MGGTTGVAGQGEVPSVPEPEPEPTWAGDEEVGFYGRARFMITRGGLSAVWGVIIRDGALRPNPVRRGSILVLGWFNDEVRFTTTELDPRQVSGTPDPATGVASGAMLDEGLLTFSFPGQHVQSEAHLNASRFEVYELGGASSDVAVTPANVAALRAGAKSLGMVEGADMRALYFE